MALPKATIHEVDFCAQMADAINQIVRQDPAVYPFHDARVEGFGSGEARRKRKDLRLFDASGKLALCGEVKLPGTPEGQSAMHNAVVADAATKADDAGVQYFFTWNVNEFALWDRSLWQRPWFERRVRIWRLARTLAGPQDVAREDSLQFIKTEFLPGLLRDLADILSGRRRDWAMPPDDVFIRSLESHLDWPVQLVSAYILRRSEEERNKEFDHRVQSWMREQDWTFVRTPHEEWVKVVDNMAKTLAYVWANRLIFYKALRARFTELPALELKPSVKRPADALAAFGALFKRAVERSGDYEPLLMPDARDWATELVFQPDNALDAWRGLLRGIEPVDFREVPSDVVGRIFQKLIGPDERHRYGQHFTGDDAVDLINSFCIRNAGDTVLDPACGSGSFLVRAYYRKRNLDARRPHLDLIGELFGCDISLYPAHLATLNLAAREINEEANYPRIARRNFFDFTPGQPFCELPDESGGRRAIPLPALDAVVGNPPYVRHEKMTKPDKARFGKMCGAAWPNLRLTGRSDLHCYFWPTAAALLKPDGYFGFLTSSSWMDVEYGFALQGWMLRHFRLLAVMESAAEPWFTDARVKTCAAILQRCDDEAERMANRVRFVRFSAKLADVIGVPPGKDEEARQAAVEALRDRILNADADFQDEHLRIIVKSQGDLWADGVRAARILGSKATAESAVEGDDGEQAEEEVEAALAPDGLGFESETYRAGKWGRYVRAPDVYFDVMRRYGDKFVALGEITTVRYGVKTGCDAFFTPMDVTTEWLARHPTDRAFREHSGGAPRKEAATSKLRIIQAGDGSVHPIEAQYVVPELHSLMKVHRPIIRAKDVNRVVLLVGESMDNLKRKSPWVWRYLQYGAAATFPSRKSKPVPVPSRSFISKRAVWYDLTDQIKPGVAFWPKGQQYRHLVVSNPDGLIANCRLYDIAIRSPGINPVVLAAVLNSTLVALWRNFYGRYTGTEGAMETMVVDALMMEVPNPTLAPARVAKRLSKAIESMCKRTIGTLVEEPLMDCHTPDRARALAAGPLVFSDELRQADRRELDDAVFELLGVSDPEERQKLLGRLYEATARHFRDIRVVEIEKMQQRAKSENRRFSVHDLAADIWDAAEPEEVTRLAEWVSQRPESDATVTIPEERPATPKVNPLYGDAAVQFGKSKPTRMDCESAGQARLLVLLANLGVSGDLKMPTTDEACTQIQKLVEERLKAARSRFQELAASRTGDEGVRGQLMDVLERWFVLGRIVEAGEEDE
jgi:methylase of polypeptide subunit release factors